MALTVEDGTGLSGADSYLSVADFKTYCDGRRYDRAGKSDTDLEAKLRLATDYIDTAHRFKGQRLVSSQALEFPRSGLRDWSGLEVTGVPRRVKHACAELAFKALSGDLYQDLERGGMVKSESVGPISTTYMDGAPAQKVFAFAKGYLEQYVRKAGDVTQMDAGFYGGSESAQQFAVGMHDDPQPASEATE